MELRGLLLIGKKGDMGVLRCLDGADIRDCAGTITHKVGANTASQFTDGHLHTVNLITMQSRPGTLSKDVYYGGIRGKSKAAG